jgi:hypothetical protein
VSVICGISYGDASQIGANARERCGEAFCSAADPTAIDLSSRLSEIASSGQSTRAIFQFSASCHASKLSAAGGVGLVDEAEVGLEPLENIGLRPQQSTVCSEQGCRAPSATRRAPSSRRRHPAGT